LFERGTLPIVCLSSRYLNWSSPGALRRKISGRPFDDDAVSARTGTRTALKKQRHPASTEECILVAAGQMSPAGRAARRRRQQLGPPACKEARSKRPLHVMPPRWSWTSPDDCILPGNMRVPSRRLTQYRPSSSRASHNQFPLPNRVCATTTGTTIFSQGDLRH
jgi:hypothetical protein